MSTVNTDRRPGAGPVLGAGAGAEPVRLDRWLWAARFFRTRALAVAAINAGHVTREGVVAKPSRTVSAGDRLQITIGQQRHELVVRATAQRRGPATEAAKLYEESAASAARRAELAEQLRLAAPPGADLGRRPTKRDRRRIDQARGR